MRLASPAMSSEHDAVAHREGVELDAQAGCLERYPPRRRQAARMARGAARAACSAYASPLRMTAPLLAVLGRKGVPADVGGLRRVEQRAWLPGFTLCDNVFSTHPLVASSYQLLTADGLHFFTI
jgi:hypothetical protein